MDERIKQYFPEFLTIIFIIITIISSYLLWTVKYPSYFPNYAPPLFGLVDWLIISIFSIIISIGIYLFYLKKKSLLSGIIMIFFGFLLFLYAIIKMAYLDDLFHTFLYSPEYKFGGGINFCNENVRNWYYLIFISFTGLIISGIWKIKETYKLEGKESEIGKASFVMGLVALICSFLPAFTNVIDFWFISHDSLAFWYMIFALIIGIVSIKMGSISYHKYKYEEKKKGTFGLFGIVLGVLTIIIDFISFCLLMMTSIVY